MTHFPRKWLSLIAGAAVVTCLAATELWSPRMASTDAVACTLYSNRYPTVTGSCIFKNGSSCYMCEYSNEGGTSTCAENADGSVQYCKKGPFTPSPNP